LSTAHNTEDKREKLQALSLAKECYSMKLDLLTNAAVIEDAGRFMQDKKKELEQQLQRQRIQYHHQLDEILH
jgi:hypothetical protein